MHPLFAAAKQQQTHHDTTTITLDLDRDIYPLPLDARAAEASARLLELRARRPGESLWRSVFRLGKRVRWGSKDGKRAGVRVHHSNCT